MTIIDERCLVCGGHVERFDIVSIASSSTA
jgi:hypothetical protein